MSIILENLEFAEVVEALRLSPLFKSIDASKKEALLQAVEKEREPRIKLISDDGKVYVRASVFYPLDEGFFSCSRQVYSLEIYGDNTYDSSVYGSDTILGKVAHELARQESISFGWVDIRSQKCCFLQRDLTKLQTPTSIADAVNKVYEVQDLFEQIIEQEFKRVMRYVKLLTIS